MIPTVNWGDESTFDFCFDGIEKGSVVAVSTYMASEHDHRKDQKEWFMAGYNEMLRRIEPERIICYNTPFPEMQGDIVYVDYERSSWRYMDYDQKAMPHEDLDCYKIGGANHTFCDTMDAYMIGKGGGSAYGGKWRPNPNKPQDQRYLGNPGEIKRTIMNNGDVYKPKWGLMGGRKWNGMRQITTVEISIRTHMTTELAGIIQMNIRFQVRRSIIRMVHQNLRTSARCFA